MNRIEEQFYAQAAQEVATKQVSPGVMAKALVDAKGDERQTIFRYIELRVQQMKEDFAEKRLREEAEAKRNQKGWLTRMSEKRENAKAEESQRVREAEDKFIARVIPLEKRNASHSEILHVVYGSRVDRLSVESDNGYERRLELFWRDYESTLRPKVMKRMTEQSGGLVR